MDDTTSNPLARHFRQPSIYITLPSKGEFWAPNSIEIPPTGEIPVFPMTTRDEILLRTPDALMNGQGVVDVIQSCVPNIKNAWHMPSVDVDAVLIAIRIASYGNEMDVDARCPHCGQEHRYGIPIGDLLMRVRCPDYDRPIIENGLKIKLRPQNYFSVNETGQRNFQEQQIMRTLADPNMPELAKKAEFEKQIKRIAELNIKVYVDSTESITTEAGVVVTNPEHIKEFYENTSRQVIEKIKKQLEQNAAQAGIPPADVLCTACHEKFSIPMLFDYASFFGPSS